MKIAKYLLIVAAAKSFFVSSSKYVKTVFTKTNMKEDLKNRVIFLMLLVFAHGFWLYVNQVHP